MNSTSPADIPALDLDPFSDDNASEPQAMFTQLQEAGPVVFLPRYGCYAVARHSDVQAVLTDWQHFSSALGGIGLGDIRSKDAWRPAGPIVEADPPNHTAARGLLQKLLSPAVVRSWREQFETEADGLVARLVEGRTFDAVTDIAETFVFSVFPRAVGLKPTEGLSEKLVLIGELNFDGLGPKNERFAATERKVEPILPWYTRSYQRENMLPGGFGELIFKAGDDGEIDPAICSGLLHSFLRGGMDTTVSTIGHVLWLLATHPAQWAALKANPALARPAFEETTRLESPITSLFRTTTCDVAFGDVCIPKDSKVQVFLGAANRDPRFWKDPLAFDIRRPTLGHVAFGFGIHMCVGQMIARLEGEAVLKALLKRAETITLAGPPVRRLNNTLRSLQSLPLDVRPT